MTLVNFLTNTGSSVSERQGAASLAGGAAQCAGAGVGAAVDGADGRAGRAARAAASAVRAQLRVQHAALVAAAPHALARAHCTQVYTFHFNISTSSYTKEQNGYTMYQKHC